MAHASTANNWFFAPKPNPRARLRLFCFPYAGGSAQMFWNWADHLPAEVEVRLAQLPGRGIRLMDAPFTRMLPLVEAVAGAIDPYLDKPFALFGHSMGAIISFELARLLYRDRGLVPAQLFVAGCRAPQMRTTDYSTYDWPETEFVADLRRLNGTPQEVFDHPDLMALILPLLRADFEIVQTYSYTARQRLKCPISAFGGLQDHDVRREHVEGWSDQTTAAFSCKLVPGDHFFIHSSQSLMLQMLSQELFALLRA